MNETEQPAGPVLCELATNPAPAGARVAYFDTTDKVRLRYATWPKGEGAPRGTICLLHGRTEFIEKYFELIGDFQQRGFAVATFDWRGQGGSERVTGNPRSGHVESFDDYWTDLSSFHGSILLPDCPPPYYVVAHSMGALVALLAGARDRLMFDRMFLSSPMLALPGQRLSLAATARLAEILCFAGLGAAPIRRRQERVPSEHTFPGNPLSSDFHRYMRVVDTHAARPDLIVGAPTVRWVAAAFKAMAEAQRNDFPARVKVPVLMLAAARDEVVSTPAIEQLGLRMRTGRHAVIAAARHELLVENDAIRAQVFAAFDAFITEQSRD